MDVGTIRRVLSEYDDVELVITGGARGADLLAAQEARARGIRTSVLMADWNQYGLAAGPIRNREMLDKSPDVVIAFHNDLSMSKGTKNMVEQAKRADVFVRIIGDGMKLTRCEQEFLWVAKAYIRLRNQQPVPPGEVPWAGERGSGTWVNRRVRELKEKLRGTKTEC